MIGCVAAVRCVAFLCFLALGIVQTTCLANATSNSSTLSVSMVPCFSMQLIVSPGWTDDRKVRDAAVPFSLLVNGSELKAIVAFSVLQIDVTAEATSTADSVAESVGGLRASSVHRVSSKARQLDFFIGPDDELVIPRHMYIRMYLPESALLCSPSTVNQQYAFLEVQSASEKSRDFASHVLSGIAYANLIAGAIAAWVPGAASTASDMQLLAVLSRIECASSADRSVLASHASRIVAPLHWQEGVLVQTVSCWMPIVFVPILHFVLLSFFPKGSVDGEAPSTQFLNAASRVHFPAFSLALAQLCVVGSSFGAARLLLEVDGTDSPMGSAFVAVATAATVVLLPVAVLLLLHSLSARYFSGMLRYLLYEQCTASVATESCLGAALLPLGEWIPDSLASSFDVILSLQKPNKNGFNVPLDLAEDPLDSRQVANHSYLWLATLPWWTPALSAFVVGIPFHFAREHCWIHGLLVALPNAVAALIWGVGRPLNVPFLNVQLSLNSLLVASIALTGGLGDPHARIISTACFAFAVVLPSVRLCHVCAIKWWRCRSVSTIESGPDRNSCVTAKTKDMTEATTTSMRVLVPLAPDFSAAFPSVSRSEEKGVATCKVGRATGAAGNDERNASQTRAGTEYVRGESATLQPPKRSAPCAVVDAMERLFSGLPPYAARPHSMLDASSDVPWPSEPWK